MKRFLLGLAAALLIAAPAFAGGIVTNGLPAATSPLTGAETLPADTNLSGGRNPQSEAVTPNQLKGYFQAPVALTNPTVAYSSTIPVVATGSALYTVTLDVTGATLETPSSLQAGQVLRVLVTQGSGGTKTLSFPGIYKWAAGTAPTLSTTAGYVDMLTFVCVSTSKCYGTASLNYVN